jgi:hypothetical protein
MNDSLLEELSSEIDSTIIDLLEKYKSHPLNISSIILARLVIMNNIAGSGDDFKMLLTSIVSNDHFDSNEFANKIH